MDDFRLNLEQTIIGACLLENSFDKVAGVLSSKSFTTRTPFDHQLIFNAIEALYPNRPVDLITVSNEVGRKPGYAHYLAYCASKVSSSCNIRSHAFILIQLNMRDILIERLDKASRSDITTLTKAALHEIIDECLDPANDIQDIYDKAPEHLINIGAEETVIAEIKKLRDGLLQRVSKIKQQAHVDCLLNGLESMAKHENLKVQLALSELKDIFKAILAKGTVPEGAITVLSDLRRRI